MAYTFTLKKGQRIMVVDEQMIPVSMIEMVGRKVDAKGAINRLKSSSFERGEVLRNDRSRRDGEQFEVGEIVFSVNADSRSHRAAITIEKNPPYLQVVRHENYKQALNN